MYLFKNIKLYWLLFIVILLISIFFRIKIIHDLPLGIKTTQYGLIGFDDEPAHLNYTKFLLKNKQLPVLKNSITDPDAFQINEFEYHQPPLYYLVIALTSRNFSINNEKSLLLLGRYFNLFLFILSIWILFKVFKILEWEIHKILSALSIYALLGSSVYQFSLFSNDGLSWVLLWTILYFVLKGLLKNWLVLILFITLSHYTKSYIFVYYPILIWAAVDDIKKYSNINTYLKLTAIFIIPVILSSPWYIRNLFSYGHFFSLTTITGDSWYFVSSLKESLLRLLHMPYSFFFRMHFDPPKDILSWFNITPYIWCICAIIYWGIQIKHDIKTNYNFQLMSILTISMIIAYVYYAIPTGYTEGRLLYPGLPGILFILTNGIFIDRIKNKLPNYIPLIAIMIIFLPSYIIGFYLV